MAACAPSRHEGTGRGRTYVWCPASELLKFSKNKKGSILRIKSQERKKSNNPGFKKALVELHGSRCVNCGSDENIEFHHIVPLAIGGTNNYGNVVPLCWRCHKAIHRGITIDDLKDGKSNNAGRKRIDKELAYDVFEKFIGGEIGNRKANELLGYKSYLTRMNNRTQFKDFLKERGIKSVRNNIDIVGSISPDKLLDGCPVGMIKYENGYCEYMKYNDTGLNDVEYIPRVAACVERGN